MVLAEAPLYRAAPRSGSSPKIKQRPPSLHRVAPRSGSSLTRRLLPPSIEQPRAAGTPPKVTSSPSIEQPCAAGGPPKSASSQPQLSRPSQRDLPQEQPPPSLYRAAPRSRSSLRSSLLPLSIVHTFASGAPPNPQNQPPPSIHRAAPRSGSSPRSRPLPPSIEQPRAVGSPPKAASSLSLSSPVQRALPYKQPPSNSLSCSPVHRELPPQIPKSSLLHLSIEQTSRAGALSKAPKQPPPSTLHSYRAAPRNGSSLRRSLRSPSID